MADNLPFEFSKYDRCIVQLRKVFKDTRSAFRDVSDSNPPMEESVSSAASDFPREVVAQLSESVDAELQQLLHLPVGIIILGQSSSAKATIVNAILQQQLLPDSITQNCNRWRMLRLRYGSRPSVQLVLHEEDSFDITRDYASLSDHQPQMDHLQMQYITEADLAIDDDADNAENETSVAALEVSMNHPLLRNGATIVVSESHSNETNDCVTNWYRCKQGLHPVVIFALESAGGLTPADMQLLQHIHQQSSCPIFFVRAVADTTPVNSHDESRIQQQLTEIGFKFETPKLHQPQTQMAYDNAVREAALAAVTNGNISSELVANCNEEFHRIVTFVRRSLQQILVRAATLLNDSQCSVLDDFILLAFDLARDVMVTPKRLRFAKTKELELYNSLIQICSSKQEEVSQLIRETLDSNKDSLLEVAEAFDFVADPRQSHSANSRRCADELRQLLMERLGVAISDRLVNSVNVFRDAYSGTLARCLASLEQQQVTPAEFDDSSATDALRRILTSAYRPDITVSSGGSFVQLLLEKIKELVLSLSWSAPPKRDAEWRRKFAGDMLNSMSEQRLAKHVCSQIGERVRTAHANFASAIRRLEERTVQRTVACELQRDLIRSRHAPRIARLALESVSIRDMILFGMPQLGREIGRGQYGVVYSCASAWGGHSPVAVKSVVPPDERHWCDLALEFYYTKQLPEHARILPVLGVVTNYAYGCGLTSHSDGGGMGAGGSPEILIISQQMSSDLHFALLKAGLQLDQRLQIACDVVEGIRFLHSQGLVHRDIKLKNVLLDKQRRAKLTDLGFCKPHAMMSGSIVGTPIHMPPELFTGQYDSSVDVYAFGILFWYICAGTVRLPFNFEQCNTKDVLWSSVKRGVRPERLPDFNDNSWSIMTQCWDSDPDARPLPGALIPQLQQLLEQARQPAEGSNS